jgi:hypothetical protein
MCSTYLSPVGWELLRTAAPESFAGRGLGDVGADCGGDIGEGRVQAGGKSFHASGGSESDERNDQGVLDEILTVFLHQVLHLCDKHFQ